MAMVVTPAIPDILGVQIADRDAVYKAENFTPIKSSLETLIGSADFYQKVVEQFGEVSGNIQLNIGLDGKVKVKRAGETAWHEITLNEGQSHAEKIQLYSKTALKALNGNEDFVDGIQKTDFKQTYKKLKKPVEPRENTKTQPKQATQALQPKGISGNNNNCWIKALTQMLNLNPVLREKVVEKCFGKDHPIAKYGEIPADQLRKAVIDAAPEDRKKEFSGTRQCDPGEALMILLGESSTAGFSTDVTVTNTVTVYDKDPKDPSALPLDTQQVEGTRESTYLLPLNMSNGKTKFTDILSDYFTTTHLPKEAPTYGDTQHRVTQEDRRFKTPPKQMMFQLNRFEKDPKTGVYHKNDQEIDVPLEIDVKAHTKDGKEHKMTLQSFIVHKGSIDSGHYYNYTKVDGQWYCINEMEVTPVSKEHVKEAAKNAYLVYYEAAKTESKKATESVKKFALSAIKNYKLLLEVLSGKHSEELQKSTTKGKGLRKLLIESFYDLFPTEQERTKILREIGKNELRFHKNDPKKQLEAGLSAVKKDPSKLISYFKKDKVEKRLLESSALLQDIEAAEGNSPYKEVLKDLKDYSKFREAFLAQYLSLNRAINEPDKEKALEKTFKDIFGNQIDQIKRFIEKHDNLKTTLEDVKGFTTIGQFIEYFKAQGNQASYTLLKNAFKAESDKFYEFLLAVTKKMDLDLQEDDALVDLAKDSSLFDAIFFNSDKSDELVGKATLEKAFDQMMNALGFRVRQKSGTTDRNDSYLSPDVGATGDAYKTELIIKMSQWLHEDSLHFGKICQMLKTLKLRGMTDDIQRFKDALQSLKTRAPGLAEAIDQLEILMTQAGI